MPHSTLLANLRDLERAGAKQLDSSGFALIETLLNRLAMEEHANNELLLAHTKKIIGDYQLSFASNKRKVETMAVNLSTDFPEHAGNIQAHLEQGELKKIERLALELTNAKKNAQRVSPLKALNELISDSQLSTTEQQPSTFEDVLDQQEAQIRSSRAQSSNKPCEQEAELIHDAPPELQSMKLFREAKRHEKIDRIIEQAITTWPENPGPHNPHMLAIKAMTSMQSLSPNYLRRLASYFETLLWLEKNTSKFDGKS